MKLLCIVCKKARYVSFVWRLTCKLAEFTETEIEEEQGVLKKENAFAAKTLKIKHLCVKMK